MTNNLIVLDDYITIQLAARRSGYGEQYIRRLVRTGKLQAVKAGCIWLIERSSLNDYLREAVQSNDQRRGPRKRLNG